MQIAAVILVAAIILALFINQLRRKSVISSQLVRFWSVPATGAVILMTSVRPAPVSRVLVAIIVSVLIREGYYLLKLNGRLKWLDDGLDYFPFLIPLAAAYPYIAQITYFFGIDLAVMIWACTIIAAYAWLHGNYNASKSLAINGWMALSAFVLLIWLAMG